MERLPRGCGVIYRAFGAPDALDVARGLRRIADRRGLLLLIGADEALAAQIAADGVHLPQRALSRGRRLRARRPHWLITGAAHNARALALGARSSLDAALLSAAFASRSPSAGHALGPVRVSALTRHTTLPVYALGGIDRVTASRLLHSRVAGLAAVGALVRTEP